jgi:hypothetical protein
MWDAIKSDLFDFVSTITEDTTKTINIVLGDTEDEDVRIMLSITLHAVPHPSLFLLYLYYYLFIVSHRMISNQRSRYNRSSSLT